MAGSKRKNVVRNVSTSSKRAKVQGKTSSGGSALKQPPPRSQVHDDVESDSLSDSDGNSEDFDDVSDEGSSVEMPSKTQSHTQKQSSTLAGETSGATPGGKKPSADDENNTVLNGEWL